MIFLIPPMTVALTLLCAFAGYNLASIPGYWAGAVIGCLISVLIVLKFPSEGE